MYAIIKSRLKDKYIITYIQAEVEEHCLQLLGNILVLNAIYI